MPDGAWLTTRREFLRAGAAVGGALAAGGIAGCGSSSPDASIVRVAIHPAVGIGRVGNSRESFFFGPEVPGALPHASGGFKDSEGAVARQAARFRVFGFDRHGRVVREVTARDGELTWRVQVANSKAAWYEFNTAFDIPGATPASRRNPSLQGSARERLAVAPPARSIGGVGAGPVALDGGSFLGEPVPLGELMTDGAGRLVFLPAQGRGYSPDSTPLGSFAENPGWTDDVCDGAVSATVRIGDRVLRADPAWVVATPPNYAPAIATGLVTAYDAARSALVDAGMVDAGPVTFAADILPIFARLVDLQWVSAAFFHSNGFGSGGYWLGDGMVARLADASAGNAAFRSKVFETFRNPSFSQAQPNAVPDLYGDHVGFPVKSNRQWYAVTPLQYRKLGAWAAGDFSEHASAEEVAASLDEVPLQLRPGSLDRAALDSVLGGAFHPGIEVPWTLRVDTMWQEPFRLRVRGTTFELPDYGNELTTQIVFSSDGPVHGVAPGDLTCWMGVPWHADGASCRSGYQRSVSTVSPTFWPARIPTQVLSQANYEIVMERDRPMSERLAAFRQRRDWERFIARPTRPPTLELMVQEWPRLGMVAERPGPGDGQFPQTFKVESYVEFASEPKQEYGADLWVKQYPKSQAN
jgi:L-Lysine epsilon oxidase N-terminal/L-lysine epsilon oxidase C-terminal domain